MASSLVREIFGPGGKYKGWPDSSPYLQEPLKIKLEEGRVFADWKTYGLRYVSDPDGEEILKDEPPSRRYGVGILYPDDESKQASSKKGESTAEEELVIEDVVLDDDPSSEGLIESKTKDKIKEEEKREKLSKALEKKGARIQGLSPEDDDDQDVQEDDVNGLHLARLRRPRSMGITFLADCALGVGLEINIEGGRYRPVEKIQVKDAHRLHTWWVRSDINESMEISTNELLDSVQPIIKKLTVKTTGLPDLILEVQIRTARMSTGQMGPDDSRRFITVTMINRSCTASKPLHGVDCLALFQSRFLVRPVGEGSRMILPLPRGLRGANEEDQSLELLYRNVHSFASGHGCAGDWDAGEGVEFASAVIAEPIPCHETPPVTPNLVDPATGKPLLLPILPLAKGEAGWSDPLEQLVALYDDWIGKMEKEALTLQVRFRSAGSENIRAAKVCLERIKDGLHLLKTDAAVRRVFHLANEAVLLQQLAGGMRFRDIKWNHAQQKTTWGDDDCQKITQADLPSLVSDEAENRRWRPFQIAFLLMSLRGLWDGNSPDRLIADLIWFPTGGGKTEAYLGAAAFLLVARRLNGSEDGSGTGVIMRYTLRLLTSQQFQRASGLICALEIIRKRIPKELGETPFRIGIWVGNSTTPGSLKDSVASFREVKKDGPEKYKHIILRCPWCGSKIGPRKPGTNWPNKPEIKEPADTRYLLEGLKDVGKGDSRRIVIHCPDRTCDFHEELPVLVVDEEIYQTPPSLIIATVDKFAMLAWKSKPRSMFGIGDDGARLKAPPGLIIQDELHLITGPLGSMVGMYEGVVEELCTDRRGDFAQKPKLIASTATTRASTRQISDLYARESTAVFPPPGLDAGDSFFAAYDRDVGGDIKPGRMYLGVHARSYGSALSVSVRVFGSLLDSAVRVPEVPDPINPFKLRDPWWTLLVFYNSLRELGGAFTIFGGDIDEQLDALRERLSPGAKRRYLNDNTVIELTGRLENSEVPRALEALERKLGQKGVIDACLASNIIEVGVDVPRLGLMAIAGQPKNTAQYIQATGRVGRESPGLVVMNYDVQKPRDLSHYEHFRDYHSRLYAAVEPSSVTPFTIQVLERALHGAFLAWIRQTAPVTEASEPRNFVHIDSGAPIPKQLEAFIKSYISRLELLLRHDSEEKRRALKIFRDIIKRRWSEWTAFNPQVWDNNDMTGDTGYQPLIRRYGEPCKTEWLDPVWATPTSMRGVDAECEAAVCKESIACSSADESGIDDLFGDLGEGDSAVG
jgi:hypothetical protein